MSWRHVSCARLLFVTSAPLLAYMSQAVEIVCEKQRNGRAAIDAVRDSLAATECRAPWVELLQGLLVELVKNRIIPYSAY